MKVKLKAMYVVCNEKATEAPRPYYVIGERLSSSY